MYELSKTYGVDPVTGADVPAPAPDATPKSSKKPAAADLPPVSEKTGEGSGDHPPETKKTGDASGDQPPETKKTGDASGDQPPETKKTGDASGDQPPETKKTGDASGDQPPETKKTGDVPGEQPPDTKKSADSQSGVNEVLDKAGIKSEDRPAVLDQIHKENPLARPEVKEPYVQSMRDLTSKWDELTKLAQDADGIDKRYFDLRPKSEKTINQLADAGLSQETAAKLLRNPEKLPELAKSDPKLAELLAHNPEQAQVLND